MNRKGFTLIEVITAIALLAVLAILITPNLINIRKDMLQKTYESRVSLIEYAALDYANDNLDRVPASLNLESPNSSCLTVTVGELIEGEYLSGSDNNKTVMVNPVTNENMNSKVVCVRYNSNEILERKLIAYIITG